jgi:hypothetical protein
MVILSSPFEIPSGQESPVFQPGLHILMDKGHSAQLAFFGCWQKIGP